jgi:hypothetical protein
MIESGLKKQAMEPLTGIFHKNMVNTAQYISVSFHLTTRNSPNVRFYQVSPRFQLSELSPDSGLDLIGSARPECCRCKIRPRDFSFFAQGWCSIRVWNARILVIYGNFCHSYHDSCGKYPTINRGVNGKISYKWAMCHNYVSLLKGKPVLLAISRLFSLIWKYSPQSKPCFGTI